MVFEKLQAIVADKLGIEESEVKMESTFRDDLGADSLDLFEIVMAIEEEFGISISNEDVEQIQTAGDAVNYITERQ
ncbi:acyl carrier protein [Cellulosilyticum sp. I15G10I2]|uniref:acyl carrier protein n=1 Tax=Cellulosilyticum sp. I15G10I2 TaxID=1892843 RepID=UPI00085C50F7|nr:acyl carrier protein [Cellulosilyticum sp. I15G10I2]